MVKKGIIALSPLLVFIVLYLVTSIIARDFYKVPITVAFMVASIYAVIMAGGIPLRKRIDIYSRGAGTGQMMLMIWIFILAGAFANSAKAMGSIDATVNLALTLLPANMLLAGLFLAACFISLSVGTSVGTIVALTPIAAGVASQTGTALPLMVAVVVGGSFFGDNLSFISDTTIVATSTQGCRLSDKFRVNSYIVIPAAIAILAIYVVMGLHTQAPQKVGPVSLLKVIPYLVVLLTAVCGMNVMAVLTLGIALTGAIGLIDGSFDFYGWMGSMGQGIMGMGELIIITMMAGGLLEIIKHQGGIDFLIQRMTRHIHTKRGAELAIAALVSLVDLCTANNTVAIITVGGIAKQIGDRFGVDNRKCASILDTFSCMMQGLIPYGAQMLMAAGLAALNPISILPYLYYPMAIGFTALLAILLRYPKHVS
ncbi:Na+/H+ antiporter NhaC family protein [Prevotella brevis]|nr:MULTISPECIES: Na+/H+ antiporter NhaC family protein [unclassified Prevotella]MBS7319074.1 Na+/H+ antiporter NhaC family protein [Prevotella sp.]MCF2560719.1 Na+/H+ antiporter NhaC family protein [Xylanibacter brevis]MDD7172387.1 Na+/H+ antiporter NhaC family protein [Prevotella sp.]MDY4683132.1 Na+/H+ antiporter NhaC family protein [Prevotella sp.]MEE1141500.1 Na+/H+ antiporter NhaC family protein [Prevotella sp.]